MKLNALVFFLIQTPLLISANYNTVLPKKWPSKIDCLLSKNEPNISDIEFLLFTPDNKDQPEVVTYENLYRCQFFNPARTTKIIIHGYSQSCTCKKIVEIKNAYLKKEPYNIILLNWKSLAASPCYLNALNYTIYIGHLLGTFLQHFLLDRVHLIGFSLGAHIAGIAGQLYEGQILRITGLDPANPWPLVKAHNYPQSEKLDKGDALNIDIIHTSHLGYVTPQGDADFYVNRLKRQPGCSHANMRCYHKRSLDFFAESILSYEKFKTMECESFGEYRKGNCSNESDVYMGESWLQSGGKRGVFYINLNDTAVGPYLEEKEEEEEEEAEC